MWQLTIDANDPMRLAEFWAVALDYEPAPPPEGFERWIDWYLSKGVPADELVGLDDSYYDRLQDPTGAGPRLWFQIVPETKDPEAKNRLHLDVYPTRRDPSLSPDERRAIVQAKVAALVERGATVLRETFGDESVYVVMQDPEGNEFCVS